MDENTKPGLELALVVVARLGGNPPVAKYCGEARPFERSNRLQRGFHRQVVGVASDGSPIRRSRLPFWDGRLLQDVNWR